MNTTITLNIDFALLENQIKSLDDLQANLLDSDSINDTESDTLEGVINLLSEINSYNPKYKG